MYVGVYIWLHFSLFRSIYVVKKYVCQSTNNAGSITFLNKLVAFLWVYLTDVHPHSLIYVNLIGTPVRVICNDIV